MSASRVPVLMYHRVGEAKTSWEARYTVPAERFAAHMSSLACSGYRAVSIDSFVDWMEGEGVLPDGAFVLTFDDGYRGVYEHALPVLEQMKWPFTVFLVSDLIGKDDYWSAEANPEGATYPLLNGDEIHTMQQRGCRFHSHSRSHEKLPTLDDVALTDQILGSRQTIGKRLGVDIDYLAYPYGQFDERVIAATKAAGYRAAFSTRSGFNQRNGNLFSVRRLDVYGTDTPAMLLRKVRLGTNDGSLKSQLNYYLNRFGLK